MLTIHIFGKSDGCTKCAALKRKVASAIGEADYRGKFPVTFHDVLTEEGLVDFCRSNINHNCIPGMVIGIGEIFLESVCTSEEWIERGNLLKPWLGIFTDYSERHRGVITTEEIRGLLDTAIDVCGREAEDTDIVMED